MVHYTGIGTLAQRHVFEHFTRSSYGTQESANHERYSFVHKLARPFRLHCGGCNAQVTTIRPALEHPPIAARTSAVPWPNNSVTLGSAVRLSAPRPAEPNARGLATGA